MDTVEIVYLGTFFVGFGFAVVSALMSGVFSGGAEAHVDVGGAHGDTMHPTAGDSVHFPLLSPVTLSMFAAAFGGSGMVYKKVLLWPAVAHLPAAAVTAGAVGLGVAWIFYKIFQASSGSSQTQPDEVLGVEAEVTTAIPADGLGEISYVARENRFSAPARSADGKAVGARSLVKVLKTVGGTFVVEKVR